MPPARYDVLGLGAVAVDDLLFVDEYPPADRKVRVRQRERQCGGLTGTALVAAARLGARAAYGGCIGVDPLSHEVLQKFRAENVDVSTAAVRATAKPAHSTIIVDETHNTRTIFSSAAGDLGPADDWPPAELLDAVAVLLIDHHGMAGTLRAVTIAREKGVPVVADFERHGGSGFEKVLEAVDHLVVSRAFAQQWTGQPGAQAAAVALWSAQRAVVVVTCGAEGCWYLQRDDPVPRHFPAYAVDARDTTGCGDVFHGAYAVALAERRPMRDRLAFASASAGIKAASRGGQAGIPSRRAVEEFLLGNPARVT